MKKIISLLLALVLCLALCACSKKAYFEQNDKIPMPDKLEIANTEDTDALTTYSFLLGDADEEEAKKIFDKYVESLEEEDIKVSDAGNGLGYTLELEDKTIGMITLLPTSDGYSLMVAIFKN